MELKDYVHLLRQHWLMVLVSTSCLGALAYGWSIAQPAEYTATSTAFVTTAASDLGSASVGDAYAKSRVSSYVQLASDRATALSVAASLNLDQSPQSLIKQVDIAQPADTVLIRITAHSGTPADAQELADAWVDALADRVQDVEGSGTSSAGNPPIKIIRSSSAELPGEPISPRPLRNAAIGMLAGLVLGLVGAILRRHLDRRIRSIDQISAFGVPVVGQLPVVPAGAGAAPLGLLSEPESGAMFHASEGFRMLRTNLAYIDVDRPPQTIVVTSPNQGDGKSSIAVNLAATIAIGGRRVTLVDGDLRRPRVAKALGLAEDVGLTDVLAGRVDLHAALQEHHGVPNLFALPSGTRPPNPSELLASEAMRNALAKLAQEGMVIVDAPPLLPVTDAAVLSKVADGVIIVVSSGRTVDTQLEASLRSVDAVSGRVLGVVLNRVARRGTATSYYKQYAYQYEEPSKVRRSGRSVKASRRTRSQRGRRKAG